MMTIAIGSTDLYTHRQPQRRIPPWRFAIRLRLWQRQLARRRFARRVLAETRDPKVLADIGIPAGRPSHVERWVTAMLWHQH